MDFTLSEALTELIGFLASFLTTGAVAFRYVVLRGDAATESGIAIPAARRAAVLGFLGALVTTAMYLINLHGTAIEKQATMTRLITANSRSALGAVCLLLVLAGLALAAANVRAGWALAAGGVLVAPLISLFYGEWARAVNPIHRLSGGLWIGTLFILLMAGLTTVLHSNLPPVQRGVLAANMVHRFSPLALIAFAILAFTGIVTAWRHLKRLDALWTTQYGWTLIAKLSVVAIVVGLGAWNWRRQRPLLGTESAAVVLRRSATAEVIAATIVLVLTSVLVSLPSPK